MTRYLTLFFSLLFLVANLNAQEEQDFPPVRKNSFYLELMGNGILYSVNYERIFGDGKIKPFLRIGGNEMHFDDSDTLRFFFVSEAGLTMGRSKNLFDLSLGYTHPLSVLDEDRLFFIRAGFRYMGPGGLIVRFAPMYAINTQEGDVFSGVWFGAALGYCF